jgi:hypothetical protein
MTAHTPGPWEIIAMPDGQSDIIGVAETGERICEFPYGFTDEKEAADAAFIVRACNAHDELLAVAQMALDLCANMNWNDDALARNARAAIAKATGGAA